MTEAVARLGGVVELLKEADPSDAELDELDRLARTIIDWAEAVRYRRVAQRQVGASLYADFELSLIQAADSQTREAFGSVDPGRSFALLVENQPAPRPEILSRVAEKMLVEDDYPEEIVAEVVARLGIDTGLARETAISATAAGIRAARRRRATA